MDTHGSVPEEMTFGEGIDICPECSHIWTDDSQSHYHDCRYFLSEEEISVEETDGELDYDVRLTPWSIFSSAL